MEQFDYRALAVLDAVATHGSFDKAATALGISQSAVSQRIKTLEDSVGRLLIVRGVPATPTGLGQRLISHYRNVKLMEATLDIDLGKPVSMPELSVAVDAASLATWFPLCLPPLLMPPRCQLEVRAAPRQQALPLVRDGAVFGAIAEPDGSDGRGPTVTPLGAMRYVAVATPQFAAHWFGDGFMAQAVKLAPAVTHDHELTARFLAEHLALGDTYPHHTLPLSTALNDCLFGGLAWGLLPYLQAAHALAQGQLLDLLPGAYVDVPLAWHAWELETPFTQALAEQVITVAGKYLVQP
ncbi:LysR family transcriptional regulator (chromosome initiation inhibitor) [Pseudoduganella flava]|uniref:ArgP/LysG family DNA-binding transcriptional regulator n=1 Tax=Pseudoduganella flava TaxID=871742 RepID=A0A562PG21_9BURK|nr:ArgP/LysG family DNA-binding transcriptional regulator [Pseudoduganella flava]QGZ40225.1 ArgP/LysG family DNA-binding transcriptional regulator [Pseudoduganella flava]TWI43405.1 LysR family transcriptional regulator (chromosome initiation inhibitor) [Pseudoduganella flava]